MTEVAVYGATGFTGRLVACALAERQLSLLLVGRDRTRLEALAATLPTTTEVAVAALDDDAALRAAFRRAKVVVSCAGPFARSGQPVLEAALAEGRHYLDINGEIGFTRQLFARAADARARGSAIVGAVGFDVAPTDAAAVLACEALDGAPVREVRLTVASTTAPSRGSARTLLHGLLSDDYAWSFVDGALVPTRIGADVWQVELPAPFGPLGAATFGLVEAVVLPVSTGARQVKTGLALSSPRAFARFAGVLRWLSRRPLLRSGVRFLLEQGLRLLPEGGSEARRRQARFAVEVRATAESGACSTVVVEGGDVGELTAQSAAACAERIVRAEHFPVGALSPTQAFGAQWLLEQLASAGVRWSVTRSPADADEGG